MTARQQGPVIGPFFFAAFLVLGTMCLGLALPAAAVDEYAVFFDNGDAGRMEIGLLSVSARDVDNGFRFTLNDDAFGDYFLSMRPFKCIAHGEQMLCYLPYPYENRRKLSDSDLTDLEYDLLFIARSPTEYGIDPWNGRYFRLRQSGDGYLGEIYETDLDILAAPPEDGSLRPLADADMVPVAAGDRQWTPRLVIEPR